MRRRRKPLRIGQCKLNGQTHIRIADLRYDGAILIFHHGMDQALRLHDHLNPVIGHAEQPVGFDDLQPFIKHGCRIDGDLPSHMPCGMLQTIRQRDLLQFLCRSPAERTAGCSKNEPVQPLPVLPEQALENGAVFAVDRPDKNTRLISRRSHQCATGHQRLFIGKRQFLSLMDRFQRRCQSGDAHHGHHHKIHIGTTHRFHKSRCANEHLCRPVIPGQKILTGLLIGNGDAVGLKFLSLRQQGLHALMGCQHRRMEPVFMQPDHIQRLCSYGTGGTENCNFSHKKLLIATRPASISGATKSRLSKRSIMPPCPGRMLPESLISHTRFI